MTYLCLLLKFKMRSPYSLGCALFSGPPRGIIFNATAMIPSVPYLSDPAQSGIKFRQFGSEFSRRKADVIGHSQFEPMRDPFDPYLDGREQCRTVRSSRENIDSGWQSDGGEVFNGTLQGPLHRFSEGNSISTSVFDLPSDILDQPDSTRFDALSLNVSFEMYAYYYTDNPFNPTFEQPMRLSTHSTPYSKIPWQWGGLAYFDAQNSPTVKYILQSSMTTPLGPVPAIPASTPRASNGILGSTPWRNCPDSPAPTTVALDSVRYFVRNQYNRILERNPEPGGWDAWTSVIARCIFDPICIHNNRIITARGIFDSPEHLNREPELGSNPVCSPQYNTAYVRLCYMTYLDRMPGGGEDQGWINYLNNTCDYTTVVGGFVDSIEYRNRNTGVVYP